MRRPRARRRATRRAPRRACARAPRRAGREPRPVRDPLVARGVAHQVRDRGARPCLYNTRVSGAVARCLSDELVLELVHGKLADEVLGGVEQHLATCADCRTLVAETAAVGSRADLTTE